MLVKHFGQYWLSYKKHLRNSFFLDLLCNLKVKIRYQIISEEKQTGIAQWKYKKRPDIIFLRPKSNRKYFILFISFHIKSFKVLRQFLMQKLELNMLKLTNTVLSFLSFKTIQTCTLISSYSTGTVGIISTWVISAFTFVFLNQRWCNDIIWRFN